jgi:hypothetical protein
VVSHAGTRALVSVGTGVTAFLVVTAGLAAALTPHIAFSVLVALPASVAVGVVVGLLSGSRLWGHASLRPLLFGAGAVGYTLVGGAAVAYTVPRARGYLTIQHAVAVAGIVGVAVFTAARATRRVDTARRD